MQQPAPGVVPSMVPPMWRIPYDQQNQQYAPAQSQQPWMMMQSQHQQQVPSPAGWAPQSVPPPQAVLMTQPLVQQYATGQNASFGEIRSLWIGDLHPWMDENYLINCFAHASEVISAKVIRNKQTGMPEGYGFVEFRTRAAAETILQTYNGTLMPNSDQNFRLNWATHGPGEKRQYDSPDHTIFVGDLAADVTDYILQETFQAYYSSVKGAKVVIDRTTGRSKGYGFVRFGDESQQVRALSEMNGVYCSTRPMRVGPAANKKPIGSQQYRTASYQNTQGNQGENDPTNTIIFVGNLHPSVSDDLLRQVFGQYGELLHVKIPAGKCWGFVQFANRLCAEQALSVLNGTPLVGQSIRLSWGHSPSNTQSLTDQVHWNGAYYGYAQSYDPYTYAPTTTQDPNMVYGGYPQYGNYKQHQQ